MVGDLFRYMGLICREGIQIVFEHADLVNPILRVYLSLLDTSFKLSYSRGHRHRISPTIKAAIVQIKLQTQPINMTITKSIILKKNYP